MNEKRRPLSAWEMILYGTGHVGTSVVTEVALAWLVYFYSRNGYASLRMIGPALIIGHVVDAVSNPIIGNWSDRMRGRFGRRRPFILFGTPVLAIAFFLLWTPPLHRVSIANFFYLAFMASLLFFAFTVAVCPYLALLPELAPERRERIRLASVQAAFNVLGVLAAVFAGLIIERLGYGPMAWLYATITWVTLWAPLAGRKEEAQTESAQPFHFILALKATLSNRPFLIYVRAYLLFWLGLRVLLVSLPFYVRAMLGMKESGASLLQGGCVVPALLLFALLPWATSRWGKRRLLLVGFLDLALGAPILALAALFPPHSRLAVALVGIVLASPAIGILFGLPNAVVADLCDYDAARTHRRREGVYFGVQGFMVKLVLGLGAWVAALTLDLLGSDAAHPGGVIAAPLICAACALGAFFAFRAYPLQEDAKPAPVEPAQP